MHPDYSRGPDILCFQSADDVFSFTEQYCVRTFGFHLCAYEPPLTHRGFVASIALFSVLLKIVVLCFVFFEMRVV